MGRMQIQPAIRILWAAAAVVLIGVLFSGIAAGVRLWLLTVLALMAAPSSFIVTPAANWLVGRLDLHNTRSIDLFVSTTVALFGYFQWFILPTLYKRGRRDGRTLSPSNLNRHEAGTNAPPYDDGVVVLFYGDDSECLSLKMLLEGSGIRSSLANFSMTGAGLGRTDVRLMVERKDLSRARPLVEQFQQQLRNSPKE